MIIDEKYKPSDFSRRVNSFENMPHFKATEYRNHLIFWAISSFKDILSEKQYENFLALALAVRTLMDDQYKSLWNGTTRMLIRRFLRKFKQMYGEIHVVCCVHKMAHLVDECQIHGTLQQFSAYAFESNINAISKLTRYSHKDLLVQMSRRLEEMSNIQQLQYKKKSRKELTYVKIAKDYPFLKKVYYMGVVITCEFRDSNFVDNNGRHLTVIGMQLDEKSEITLQCKVMEDLRSAFDVPVPDSLLYPKGSGTFHIYKWKMKYKRKEIYVKCTELKYKICCLPYGKEDNYEKVMIILPMSDL